MANVTFHDKPALVALDGTEEFPLWQTSTAATRKALLSTIKQFIANPATISATGSDQSGAAVLSNSYDLTIVSIVPPGAGTKFAPLSASQTGSFRLVHVYAGAGNVLLHYPPAGGRINGRALNDPIPIEPDTTAGFIAISTTDWITYP